MAVPKSDGLHNLGHTQTGESTETTETEEDADEIISITEQATREFNVQFKKEVNVNTVLLVLMFLFLVYHHMTVRGR